MNNDDTIVAQATPIGKSSVGIIRISGNKAYKVAKLLLDEIPKARYAKYLNFFNIEKKIIDKGIAIWFPKPHSFTGEDVLELQAHGGQIILNIILKNILSLTKIRLAKPGEFAERAFLNNKIDLIQAESIIDLINANSEKAAEAAIKSLQGTFSNIIKKLLKSITNIRVLVESNIDFTDQEIDSLEEKKIKNQLKNILYIVNSAILESKKTRKIYDGTKIVIAGNVNVGKSSLMNKIIGKNVSIVTNIAGTTRDLINEYIDIEGLSLRITDTAGLRKTDNLIESIGIRYALEEIYKADYLIFVIDNSVDNNVEKIILNTTQKIKKFKKISFICNKIDLVNKKSQITKVGGYNVIYLSSLTGEGIDLLIKHLKDICCRDSYGYNNTSENYFLARHRHITSLKKVRKNLIKGIFYLSLKNIELLAEELKFSQQNLGEITGQFTTDDLLANIFSKFCIGK